MKRESLLDHSSVQANKNIKARKYWENRLKELKLQRYFDVSSKAVPVSSIIEEYTISFDTEITEKLSKFGTSEQAKHLILLGAVGVLANKYSQLNDLILFTTNYQQEKRSQILPVRLSGFEDTSFKELLGNLKNNFIQDLKYASYPTLRLLTDDLNTKAKRYATSVTLTEIQGEVSNEMLIEDLQFCFSCKNSLSLKLKYNSLFFSQTEISTIAKQFSVLLEKLLSNLETPLHQITLLSESEQVFLLEGFN
uniref:condensation domain-containing protein n=1 Tax=Ascidiimonas meishanensis TaxID=3128903 RepID=UPI0030EB4E5B